MFPLLLVPLASCLTSPWLPMLACATVIGVFPWWFNRRNERAMTAMRSEIIKGFKAETASRMYELDVFESMLRDAEVPYARTDPPDSVEQVLVTLYLDHGPALDCIFRQGRLLSMRFSTETRI